MAYRLMYTTEDRARASIPEEKHTRAQIKPVLDLISVVNCFVLDLIQNVLWSLFYFNYE